MGHVSNLADRLYCIDASETFPDREFCVSKGLIEIRGQLGVGCHPVAHGASEGMAGLDQVAWL
jgi:hypothetical protein